MPIAIHTKYVPATATRGSRIKAFTHRGFRDGRAVIYSVTVDYSHTGDEHDKAALALLRKFWPADRNQTLPQSYELTYIGASADGLGYVYSAR